VIIEEVPNKSKSIPGANQAISVAIPLPPVEFCCLLFRRVQIGAAAQDATALPVYFLLTVAAAASGTTGAAIVNPFKNPMVWGKLQKGIPGGFPGKAGTVAGGNRRGMN